jgi:hypothetical protein
LSSYPYRVPTTQRLLVSFRTRADLPGLSVLFAASPVRVYSTRELPNSHYVPPSGFHSLSVVYSAHRLAGLFHPTATFRILPFRGLLPPCSHLPSSGRVAPMSLRPQLLAIRRWFHVRRPSTSRPCSARRSVLLVRRLTSPSVAPLVEFLPLQVLCSRSVLRLPVAIRS